MFNIMYPPRPKNPIPPESIQKFEDGFFMAQPKLNGSQGVLYLSEKEFEFRNRHKELLTRVEIDSQELLGLHRGKGEMILCGEYLNKNKKHLDGADFNHKYVLFDILMFEGVHLVGQTFSQRQNLLRQLYREETKKFDGFIPQLNDLPNVYLVETFDSNFTELYHQLVQIDMYEGIVLKDKYAGLEYGFSEDNNHKSQVKARKPTKNYAF